MQNYQHYYAKTDQSLLLSLLIIVFINFCYRFLKTISLHKHSKIHCISSVWFFQWLWCLCKHPYSSSAHILSNKINYSPYKIFLILITYHSKYIKYSHCASASLAQNMCQQKIHPSTLNMGSLTDADSREGRSQCNQKSKDNNQQR